MRNSESYVAIHINQKRYNLYRDEFTSYTLLEDQSSYAHEYHNPFEINLIFFVLIYLVRESFEVEMMGFFEVKMS